MHMLRKATELQEYQLHTREGPAGTIEELYFDEETWTVRYLSVDAGSRLPGHSVLISPVAVGMIDDHRRLIPVDATLERIRKSPGISAGMRIHRKFETDYYRYYGWPAYWRGPERWGMRPYPVDITPPELLEYPLVSPALQENDSCLRSTRQLSACSVQSIDGEIGRVEDFIIDDETWALRYLVVYTGSWWPGQETLISPHWIVHVDWASGVITLDLMKEHIRRSPGYDRRSVINRGYETRLFSHYGREPELDAVRVDKRTVLKATVLK